jgi:hypothetical protein
LAIIPYAKLGDRVKKYEKKSREKEDNFLLSATIE